MSQPNRRPKSKIGTVVASGTFAISGVEAGWLHTPRYRAAYLHRAGAKFLAFVDPDTPQGIPLARTPGTSGTSPLSTRRHIQTNTVSHTVDRDFLHLSLSSLRYVCMFLKEWLSPTRNVSLDFISCSLRVLLLFSTTKGQ